jgi:hypothetical protein
MRRTLRMSWFLGVLAAWTLGGVSTAKDPGKEPVGQIQVELIFGTDKNGSVLGSQGKPLEAGEEKRLKGSEHLKFAQYRSLGSVKREVLRGYENWAAPLGASEEILVSFEPKGRVGQRSVRMDLEFWQSRQKVLKTDPVLEVGKRLYILGPKWRDGRLIIAVELLGLKPQ